MQTLGEESAAHAVEVHEVRIGIYERILAYRHLLAATECLDLYVIGNGVGCQLDDCGVAVPVVVIDGLHRLHKAVGIFLRPLFAVVGEHYAVFVEQDAVRRYFGRHDFLSEKLHHGRCVDVSRRGISGYASFLVP